MHRQLELKRTLRQTAWLSLVVLAVLLWMGQIAAGAQEIPASDDPFWSNDTCLTCHQQTDLSVALPSNETLGLAVFRTDYEKSVHGQTGIGCRNCHLDIAGFPHPELTAGSLGEFSQQQAATCEMCHRDHYGKVADELHAGTNELVCSDCHDPHTTGTSNPVSAEVQKSCDGCHSGGVAIPSEGIHAAPEVPEHESTSGVVILAIAGGLLVGFVILVWLITVAWRTIRNKA
ncbi:MAG: cytochrome c3 family protein [Acidimicrobiia bacterium]|nr:cytochrome c3 family protein [Acidimicrobiia bacterium]